MDLNKFDLNLLRTLDVLLHEQHVSRAASTLNLSQPATSAALARLRESLGDALLVRGAGGMQPTERAAELAPKVRKLLEQVTELLASPAAFDPKQARVTFNVASTDYFIELATGALSQRLRDASPAMRFVWRPLTGEGLLEKMERGTHDLAITNLARAPESLHSRLLVKESYVGIASKKNKHAKDSIGLAQLCALPHALVTVGRDNFFSGVMDEVLAARGLKRNVVMSVPQFRFAVDVVEHSDVVAIFPARLAARYANRIRQFALPVAPKPFEIVMTWHERTHRSAPHQWLRKQILELVQ